MAAAHPQLGMGGPGYWAAVVIPVLAALGALAIVVDVVRRGERMGGLGRRLLWAVPQALYLVALAAGYALKGKDETVTAVGVMLLVAIPLQVAYLLRVVFPKAPGHGASIAVEDAGSPAPDPAEESHR